VWLFWVGPIVGAALGALVYNAIAEPAAEPAKVEKAKKAS
jgi:hypothetical protein